MSEEFPATKIDEARLISKIAVRIIPLVAIGLVVAYIDRSNIGMASLTMGGDLGLNATILGWGAGIFFFGYVLFEVPSNMVLARVGARIWLCRIMVTWGIVSIAMALVRDAQSFYIARFLLGAAEAGFVPGVIYYFSHWFPARYRTRMFGLFIAANPVAGVIGNPISGFLLQLDGWLGLRGWQWIFVIEGIPAIILAFAIYMYLPDGPRSVTWLEAEESKWLKDRLAAERSAKAVIRIDNFRNLLLDGRVWILTLAYLGIASGSYGIIFWLPQILKGFGLDNVTIGLLAATPWLCAAVGTVLWSLWADRARDRAMHLGAACFTGFVGLAIAAYAGSPAVSLAGLAAAAVGILSATAIFWALPTTLLSGAGLAAGVAFINAIGSFGGFLGPYLMGWLKDFTGDYKIGLVVLASGEILAAAIAISFRHRLLATQARIAPAA